MALLNYTTKISVARTAAEVQAMLVAAGARQISFDYESGEITGLVFGLSTVTGNRLFALPVQTGQVAQVLRGDGVEPRYSTDEHAKKVAWRILKDWLEAQLALVKVGMAALDQVMLPYMTDDATGRTVYELYTDRQLALGTGS